MDDGKIEYKWTLPEALNIADIRFLRDKQHRHSVKFYGASTPMHVLFFSHPLLQASPQKAEASKSVLSGMQFQQHCRYTVQKNKKRRRPSKCPTSKPIHTFLQLGSVETFSIISGNRLFVI